MSIADQAERDRITETGLGDTLFVEAGPGTGKTEALVQRIVNLIESGEVQANQIAAITFTAKAAAELFDRVTERLDQRREQETDPSQQRWLAAAIEQLDQSAIETLHAFASRVLGHNPIEAGLPPGFEVVDEAQAAVEFRERWQAQLDELLEHQELADALLDAFDAGIDINTLEQVAMALHRDWDRTEADVAQMDAEEVDFEPFLEVLDDAIWKRGLCWDETDKAYLRLTQLASFAEQLREAWEAQRYGRLIKLLKHTTPTSLRFGNAGSMKNWTPSGQGDASESDLPAIRAQMKELNEQREEMRHAFVQLIIEPIFNELRRFVLEYADERRRQGQLQFQDLLVRAKKLLTEHPTVANQLGRRFRRVLVDEFQDNDPLQTDIVNAITRGKAGRLFLVGDPKQSIYRFRRADIRQFNRVKAEQHQGLVRLSQNFRSTPGVTSFVNEVFRPLMLAGGQDQAEWETLAAFREPLEPQGADLNGSAGKQPAPVTVLVRQTPLAQRQVLEREARELTQLIATIHAEEWPIYDKPAQAYRAARYADIAILAPSRSGLRQLLPTLEANDIPYRLESRSLTYDTQEVRDLLCLLQALDDPTDQVALVATLRSPGFACADDDLNRWRRAGGRWSYRAARPEAVAEDDPVAESMAWLKRAAERRWEWSVSELLLHAIRDRRLLELAVTQRQPREWWQRYRFMLDQSRAFADRGGATLSDFLEWARQQAEQHVQVIESVVPEEDHDAVRIMTVHAAKGLEFPIVVCAGLNTRLNTQSPALFWQDDGRPEVRLSQGLETPGYAGMQERDKQLAAAEQTRLIYVAATRARDYLVMSLHRRQMKSEGKTSADLIAKALLESEAEYVSYQPDEEALSRLARAARPQSWEPVDDTPEDRGRWIQSRADAVSRLTMLPRGSATGVARQSHDEFQSTGSRPNHEPRDDLPAWRRGRAGTAIGRATHAVLQVIDLSEADDASIEAAAQAQAASESLGSEAAQEIARLVRRALDSETVRAATRAPRRWRELYAAVEIDGVLLDGFIDLLYEQADGSLVVVDYKTDALADEESVQAAVERYRLQAAAYGLMLEATQPQPVSRCVLLFLHADAEREAPNLEQAMAEVRVQLQSQRHRPAEWIERGFENETASASLEAEAVGLTSNPVGF